MKILLASQSRYRRELLDRLNITYAVASPTVDEELLKKNATVSLLDLPLYLAQKKAESLCDQNVNGITIGCDQMAILNNQVLHKPGTAEKALQQLLDLQNQTHVLITAMAIHFKGQWFHHTDITRLTMAALDKSQLERYIQADQPLDCAGSYKIEKQGIALFDRIETEDFTAITGLPLLALSRTLKKLGVKIP